MSPRYITVVILSKTTSNLRPCIDAVLKHEHHVSILVVDDGLTDGGYAPHPDVEYIPGQKPFIFARNANIGIRAAGDRDVILLNDDALLESPGGFSLLAESARQHPQYGIIGATTNVTGQLLQQRRQGPDSGLREVPHIAFVCVLIPWRTRTRIQGSCRYDNPGIFLDERYCLDYGVEDRDYCEQVRVAGFKIGVHDGCFVDHGSLRSTFRGDPQSPKDFSKNFAVLKEKWGRECW